MLRIGTRASALARWQAEWVAWQLRAGGHEVQLVPITTRGDADQRDSIASLGAVPGVFTKELQRALLDARIDLAVHSLKDLPTDEVVGLTLAAVPPRESPFDVLVSRKGLTLVELPPGAKIGSGSLRRRAQLWHARPDLEMLDIRGNVDTRLAKLDAGQFDAIVLAYAGLARLGLADRVTEVFAPEVMLPAVGQGALGIESRSDDAGALAATRRLDDPDSRAAVIAERSMLAALLGGCLAPVGAWARVDGARLRLSAVVLGADGKQRLAAEGADSASQAESLGQKIAVELLGAGAGTLIAQARGA